jgi:hypothetical protein
VRGREGGERNANGVPDRAKMRICRAAVQIKAAVQLLGKENDRQQERKNIESLAVSGQTGSRTRRFRTGRWYTRYSHSVNKSSRPERLLGLSNLAANKLEQENAPLS